MINKAIPLLIFFAGITVGFQLNNTDEVLCEIFECYQCIEAPYCYWCNGEVSLYTGPMVWGYCMMASQSKIRRCELDGGISFIGNDTSTCATELTRNYSDSLEKIEEQPNSCPYNGCNMCNKVNNCSWCQLRNYDLWTCMGQHEVAQFGTICKDTCVEVKDTCQSSTCSSCIYQNTCTWCGGQYTSLKGEANYTWGFCSPENSSQLCQLEGGNILSKCAPYSLYNNSYTLPRELTIDEDPDSIERMGDPNEDPCTTYTSCTTCMAQTGCGWCSSPIPRYDSLPWGECRGIFTKKNGEYGKQFCERENGFWRESDCVPDQLEVAVVLKQLSVWDYQNWFSNQIYNINQFGNNFLIGSNSTLLITLIAVEVYANTTTNHVNVLIFQQLLQPIVPISHDLMVLQCEEMIAALWGLAPKYLYKKLLNCTGIRLHDHRLLSEITIEETKPDLSNSASRMIIIVYFWPVLLFLVT